MFDLANQLLGDAIDPTTEWLDGAGVSISAILIAAFGIAVGFVAYKLIKRALNKA